MAIYTGGYATTYDLNSEDLPPSMFDVAKASASEGFRSGMGGIASRYFTDSLNKRTIAPIDDDTSPVEDSPNQFAANANYLQSRRIRLSKEDAEKQVQGLNLKIPDGGISAPYLKALIDRTQDNNAREKVIRSAPSGFTSGSVQMLSNLAGGMADPTNIALSFIPVVGAARTEAMLARAGGILGRSAVRAGVGAVEGAVGQALIEPFTALDKLSNQQDYTLGTAIEDIAMGAGFGAAAHVGFHAVAKTFGMRDRFQGRAVEIADAVSPETNEAAVRAIIAADAEGKHIDISPIVEIDPRAKEAGVVPMAEPARVDMPERPTVSDFQRSPITPEFAKSLSKEDLASLFKEVREAYSTDKSLVMRQNWQALSDEGVRRMSVAAKRGPEVGAPDEPRAPAHDNNSTVSADMDAVRTAIEKSRTPEADRYYEPPMKEEVAPEEAEIIQHADDLAQQVKEIETLSSAKTSALAEALEAEQRAQSFTKALRAAAVCGVA